MYTYVCVCACAIKLVDGASTIWLLGIKYSQGVLTMTHVGPQSLGKGSRGNPGRPMKDC